MTITIVRTQALSDENERKALWKVYINSFQGSASRSVQNQICYNEESFMLALTDCEYWKFVVMHNGIPAGFVLATNNLDKASVAYINPEYFRAREPDACLENRLFYFTAIAVEPKHQQTKGLFYLLIEDITKFIDEHEAVVSFDSSNETGKMIPEMIERATLRAQKMNPLNTNHSSYEEVGGQRYFIQKLSQKP